MPSTCQLASPQLAWQLVWYCQGRDCASASHRATGVPRGSKPFPANLGAFARWPGVRPMPGACLGLLGAVPIQAIQGAPRPQRWGGASFSAYASQGLQGD